MQSEYEPGGGEAEDEGVDQHPLLDHAPVYRPLRTVLFAVLTGDITGGSRIEGGDRQKRLDALRSSFGIVTRYVGRAVAAPFDIYRGDSFQGILSSPERAVRASIMIRASLRDLVKTRLRRDAPDARIAIGIGSVDYFPGDDVLEGDGEAFRRSGETLDAMKGDHYLRVATPWPDIDEELAASCALLDALTERWTAEQARAVLGRLQGKTQEEIAGEIGISQPAVGHRLKAAGCRAVEAFCSRFEHLIEKARTLDTSSPSST